MVSRAGPRNSVSVGTSAAMLSAREAWAGLPNEFDALHIGTLALVVEPTASVLETLVEERTADHIIALDPLIQLIAEEQFLRATGTVENDHASKSAPLIEYLVDQRTKRSQAKPSRGKKHILSSHLLNREPVTEGATDTELRARL